MTLRAKMMSGVSSVVLNRNKMKQLAFARWCSGRSKVT